MAEISLPWGGTSTGDKGPYTSTQWADVWATLFTVDQTTQGIVPWYGGKLTVTGTTSNATVASGAAIVHGSFYKSDANTIINIPSAVSTTRTDYIVLRKSHTAQTVRLTRLAGTEGGSAPSLTQNTTTYWDVRIASVTVNSAGALTIVNDNNYIHLGVPVNGVIYSTSTTIPAGFAELTTARGRFIVGLPSGGTINGTVGTALKDLGTMTHTHPYSDLPRHAHGGMGRFIGQMGVNNDDDLLGYFWTETKDSHGDWRTNWQVYPNQLGASYYTGSATCNTLGVKDNSATPPYLQLMVLVKS